MIKLLDKLIALSVLVILSPIFILIMLVNLATGEHNVFYYQKRVGENKKPFLIIKFATMLKASESMGAKGFTEKNDFRLLPLGKFLRASKLNEMPQLFNVLRGEMSLVGTRPMVPSTFDVAKKDAAYNFWELKPGITGFASIFFRNEEVFLASTEDKETYFFTKVLPMKLELDYQWYQNPTMLNYLKVLMLTVWVLFFPPQNERDVLVRLDSKPSSNR